MQNIKQRCENKRSPQYRSYGAKGIRCLLSVQDLEIIWKRDRAGWMKQPSVDRIDNVGNYSFKNCRFLEKEKNTIMRNAFELYRDGLISNRRYRIFLNAPKYQRLTLRKYLTRTKEKV